MSYTSVSGLMTGICDAIRAKDGTSATINHHDIPDRIAAIPTGGGSVTEKDVNFYDFDGTLVAGYTLAEAQALTALPDPPDHSGDTVPLTFQGWNYTLPQVNALTGGGTIGAMYLPTDGKTHILYTVTAATGTPTLTMNNSGGGTMTVDWGDGSGAQTNSTSGAITFTPASGIAFGNYDLTIDSTGEYALPTLTSSTYIFGDSTRNRAITHVYLGTRCVSLGAYAFKQCMSLVDFSVSPDISNIGNYTFNSCALLKALIIPAGSVGSYALNTTSVFTVSMPPSTTIIQVSAFRSTYSLRQLSFPATISYIDSYAFNACWGLSIMDFTSATSIPTLNNTNSLSSISPICKIKVPAALYSSWITATNWSTYADYIVGV